MELGEKGEGRMGPGSLRPGKGPFLLAHPVTT